MKKMFIGLILVLTVGALKAQSYYLVDLSDTGLHFQTGYVPLSVNFGVTITSLHTYNVNYTENSIKDLLNSRLDAVGTGVECVSVVLYEPPYPSAEKDFLYGEFTLRFKTSSVHSTPVRMVPADSSGAYLELIRYNP